MRNKLIATIGIVLFMSINALPQDGMEVFPPIDKSARLGFQMNYEYGRYLSQLDLDIHGPQMGMGYSISNFMIFNLLMGYSGGQGHDESFGRHTDIDLVNFEMEFKLSPLSMFSKRVKSSFLPIINFAVGYHIAEIQPYVDRSEQDEIYSNIPNVINSKYPGLGMGLELRAHILQHIDLFISGYGWQYYTNNMAGHSIDVDGKPFAFVEASNVVAAGVGKFGITMWISGDGSGFYRKHNNYAW